MKKNLIFLICAAIAMTIIIFYNKAAENQNSENNQNSISKFFSKVVKNEETALSSDQTVALHAENKISDTEFTTWVQTEVENIERPVTDPISAEEKTKNFVNQLSSEQIKILMQKVLNTELPMNERIFTNYALTLFSGENANQNLYDLINSKMPEYKNVQVHSEDEVKRAQDYALRYSQIDALATNAENGSNIALSLLTQIANNGTEDKIQNYAKRKLKEISK